MKVGNIESKFKWGEFGRCLNESKWRIGDNTVLIGVGNDVARRRVGKRGTESGIIGKTVKRIGG